MYIHKNSPFWDEQFYEYDKHMQSCNQDAATIKVENYPFNFLTNPTHEL